jgi:hypothetical protein
MWHRILNAIERLQAKGTGGGGEGALRAPAGRSGLSAVPHSCARCVEDVWFLSMAVGQLSASALCTINVTITAANSPPSYPLVLFVGDPSAKWRMVI